MGINPCPYINGDDKWALTHVRTKKKEQQVGINPYSYTKRDDKWETTHVHQTHSIKSMQAQNNRQKIGQDSQNLLVLGSHNHKRV